MHVATKSGFSFAAVAAGAVLLMQLVGASAPVAPPHRCPWWRRPCSSATCRSA
jgi:hypothetical protein